MWLFYLDPKGLLTLNHVQFTYISQASLVCPWENDRSLWGSPSTQTHWEIHTGQVPWKGMGLGGKIKINVMPPLRRSRESRRATAVTVQWRKYYPHAEASQEGQPVKQKAGSLLRGSGLGGTAWHGPLGGPSKGPPHHCSTHDKGFHYCGSVPQPRNLSGPAIEKGSIWQDDSHCPNSGTWWISLGMPAHSRMRKTWSVQPAFCLTIKFTASRRPVRNLMPKGRGL